jgi:putative SOS response-associated peptidase YedK
VILHPESEAAWLNPDNQTASDLIQMLRPYDSEQMEAFEVSDYVNSPSNQGPLCIRPVNTSTVELSG